jgi:outer membrane protein OmpA-like peptidoglycan-associated protein
MKRVSVVLLSCFLFCLAAPAAAQKLELQPGYYLIVGVYASSRENVAQNYVDVLNRQGYSVSYGFNSRQNRYFVYLQYFDNLKSSLQQMHRVRKAGKFTDAWVRVIPGDVSAVSRAVVVQASSAQPVPVAEVSSSEPATFEKSPEAARQIPFVAEPETLNTITENAPIVQYDPMTLGNTEVFLSMFNAQNNRIVDGEVQVVDTERSKLITRVKGNEYLLLPDPKSKSGQLTLICEAFGYRKVQQEINYPVPLADTVKPFIDLMGTTIVINFDLVRYHKGDIATLYNVYFYNDASLMLPESKYELNSLLQMMQENPKYRIRLHGHTNGSYHGKILALGDNKNFFSLDGSRSLVGSAKDLARNRAETIREYLVANGIDGSRMEVKSWGGRRPLYDRHSVNAKRNVRVEVEILQE